MSFVIHGGLVFSLTLFFIKGACLSYTEINMLTQNSAASSGVCVCVCVFLSLVVDVSLALSVCVSL